MHTHPFSEILVVEQGCLHALIAGQEVTAHTGDALYYPPHTPHREWTGEHSVSFVDLLIDGRVGLVPHCLVRDTRRRIPQLAQWMLEEIQSHAKDSQRRVDTLLGILLEELAKPPHEEVYEPFQQLRAYMRNHLTEHHTLEALAEQVGMSRYYFVRRYKQVIGYTPMEDLRLLRIDRACHLLLTTDFTLRVIADQVGFCDEFYFSRAFRRQMQVTPVTFRKQSRSS